MHIESFDLAADAEKVLAWYRIYTAGAPRSPGSARLTAGALTLRSPRTSKAGRRA